MVVNVCSPKIKCLVSFFLNTIYYVFALGYLYKLSVVMLMHFIFDDNNLN